MQWRGFLSLCTRAVVRVRAGADDRSARVSADVAVLPECAGFRFYFRRAYFCGSPFGATPGGESNGFGAGSAAELSGEQAEVVPSFSDGKLVVEASSPAQSRRRFQLLRFSRNFPVGIVLIQFLESSDVMMRYQAHTGLRGLRCVGWHRHPVPGSCHEGFLLRPRQLRPGRRANAC